MTIDSNTWGRTQQAKDMGIEAGKAGQASAPMAHKEVMDLWHEEQDERGRTAILLAFARGWTMGNLAEEVTYDSM
jgi:hypothetical protein